MGPSLKTKRILVGSDSPYLEQFDFQTRLPFKVGDMIVDCGRGHLYTVATWQALNATCPLCAADDASMQPTVRMGVPQQVRAKQDALEERLGASLLTMMLGVLAGLILAVGLIGGIWLIINGRTTSVELQATPALPATVAPMLTLPSTDTPDDAVIPVEATAAALIAAGNPLALYSLPVLRVYPYDGGTIDLIERYQANEFYEQWAIAYQSEGLRVTGLVNIPTLGDGPYPVAIVLHGGIDQASYVPGDGSRNHADLLARAGYIAFMPDYRSYNNTGGTGTPLKLPWVIDVMNLIDALPTLPEADPARIGVLGHSRGGGLASYIMELSDEVDAVVLYAPLHTNQAIVWEQYNSVFNVSWPQEDAGLIGSPTTNPAGYAMVSPSNYLEWTTMPVQVHHGSADTVLPVEWSRGLHETLLGLGVDATYYEYPGAGHTFTGENYILFMERVTTFFEANVRQSSP